MPVRKKIALRDIADKFGVSTALVSYVLNGKFTDRIHPETAKKIRDFAHEIKYQPNQIAKSLKNNKTFTIGLIVADISNLFSSGIARVIEDEAKRNHYNVIFGSADEKLEKFEELVQVFVSRQVDGLILASPEGAEDRLNYLLEQQIPFVLIDRYFPGLQGFNSVIIDNYKASFVAVKHLVERGYKKPVMVTLASNLFHLQDRSRGFKEAVEQKFGKGKAKIIEIPQDELHEKIDHLILQLLKDDPDVDAIYFSTNKIALEGLAVLAKHKIAVPKRIGVICFDEADAYKIFHTSITFVKQPLGLIGKEAVDLLIDQTMSHSNSKSIVLDTSIVTGNSTNIKI